MVEFDSKNKMKVAFRDQSETQHKIRIQYKFDILCQADTDFLGIKSEINKMISDNSST